MFPTPSDLLPKRPTADRRNPSCQSTTASGDSDFLCTGEIDNVAPVTVIVKQVTDDLDSYILQRNYNFSHYYLCIS